MRKNVCVYGAAAVSLIGMAAAAVLEMRFRRKINREITDIKMFQTMESDFLNHHSKKVEKELEEIRDEIGTVYEHFEEIENIRAYGR